MIIKNNKPKGQYFRYKVGGKIQRVFIAGNATVEVPSLTATSQIVSNTYERRLRHIEESFGHNFQTSFEVPGDPDFIVFVITSSTSALGTISPLGAARIAEGENSIFYMNPSAVAFGINASTLGSSGGTISPSGTSVSSNAYNYLSALSIDGNANQLSAVTGTASATTQYTFTNVFSSHTISATFALMTGSTTFTMTPQSNFYLNALTVNGSNKVSGVTGSVSGASTYTITNINSANTISALFKAYGQ